MVTQKSAGVAAWAAAIGGTATRWSDRIEQFSANVMDVVHQPKFMLAGDAGIFCIGSCFARNIEEHLIYQEMNVLSRRIFSPKHEWPRRTNGFVNKFTTHSIRNEIEWALKPPVLDETFFEERANGYIDLQLSPQMPPVPRERAIERRAYLTREYFARLRDASVVIITLGLNEVWFDKASNRHVNGAPSFYAARREPERYELHITDVAENLAELEEIRRLLHSLSPGVQIVVTVSPVPMSETFSGHDVVIANMYSKSTLRAAAEQFAQAHADVDYFPSYDIVASSPRLKAYEADCLHVSDETVGRVIQCFLRLYLGLEREPPEFSELAYLEANPDVEAAVRRGELASGFEHWRAQGGGCGAAVKAA